MIRWAYNREADYILIGGRIAGDVRSLQVEGPSGILKCSPPRFVPRYYPSKREIHLPNGVIGSVRYGDEPDGFRGFQGGRGWLDELFRWKYAKVAFDNLMLGMREAGADGGTKLLITSTPKPTPLMRAILKDPDTYDTRGSTRDNRANLDPRWLAKIERLMAGIRHGRQELDGEVLEDCPGALWSWELVAKSWVELAPTLELIVIGVDPAMSEDGAGAETGIVVVGLGDDGHAYVLEDASGAYTAEGWASEVVELYRKYGANYVVAEVNNGGNLVTRNLRVEDPSVPVKTVHAKKGKRLRAEPVLAQYERGLVHHVLDGDPNRFAKLEHQQTQVDPDELRKARAKGSGQGDNEVDWYDRVDAEVYAVSFAMFDRPPDDAGDWLDAYRDVA